MEFTGPFFRDKFKMNIDFMGQAAITRFIEQVPERIKASGYPVQSVPTGTHTVIDDPELSAFLLSQKADTELAAQLEQEYRPTVEEVAMTARPSPGAYMMMQKDPETYWERVRRELEEMKAVENAENARQTAIAEELRLEAERGEITLTQSEAAAIAAATGKPTLVVAAPPPVEYGPVELTPQLSEPITPAKMIGQFSLPVLLGIAAFNIIPGLQ